MANAQQHVSTLKGLPSTKPTGSMGDYVIVAELARGGMGCVYLARRHGQAGFERHFAIKVMNHNLSDDQNALAMLLDEAHIASRLHHPNVVSVLDIGVADGGYYLVMDYVEGCSLQDLMQRNRASRPPELVIPILLDALHGLHAVHTLRNAAGESYGVVHRDVSPHNLLVGLDGGCRVTDFGIAKASERFTDTQAGVFKGKLAYMAPEQLLQTADIDRRTDVWAAGVTLYAALTHHHPFRGPNDASTLNAIMTSEIPPPSQVGLRPPPCLDAVVLKALARNRDERFQSAQEFGEELRRVALAHDLLGAPSKIAAWVEDSFGKELTERRRKIRLVTTTERESMTESGKVPVVPRLWTPQDEDSASGRRAAASFAPPAPDASSRPLRRALAGAAVLGVAMGIVALAIGRMTTRERAPQHAVAAAVAPKPAAGPVRAAPESPDPRPTLVRTEAVAPPPSALPGTTVDDGRATREHARARGAAMSSMERTATTEAEPVPAPAPAPIAVSTPSPAPTPTPEPVATTPAPARRSLERNPYLSAE